MVTTRSQSLSMRVHADPGKSSHTKVKPTHKYATRSQTLSARLHSDAVEPSHTKVRTMHQYATRSTRMNTRSNEKRFLQLSDKTNTRRMTRSMTNFINKYSAYTGVKTRSMTAH